MIVITSLGVTRRSSTFCLLVRQTSDYNETACTSWNSNLVPELTTNVPAVCPYRRCRAVVWVPSGWTLFVFIATLRPFTETHVKSTLSGSDLRGLAREERIFPKAFVPALNTTFLFTETSSTIFTSKLLPTTSCDEMPLSVCTVSVVPAGIVAALKDGAATKDEAATQAEVTAITAMKNFSRLIFVLN